MQAFSLMLLTQLFSSAAAPDKIRLECGLQACPGQAILVGPSRLS
jgi:hypothetical protein